MLDSAENLPENSSSADKRVFKLGREEVVPLRPGKTGQFFALAARTQLPMNRHLELGTNLITRIFYPSRNPSIQQRMDYSVPFQPGLKGNHRHYDKNGYSFFELQLQDSQLEPDPGPDLMPGIHLNSLRYSLGTYGLSWDNEDKRVNKFLTFADIDFLSHTFAAGNLPTGGSFFRQFMNLDAGKEIAPEAMANDDGVFDYVVLPMELNTEALFPGFDLVVGMTFKLEIPVDITGIVREEQLDRLSEVVTAVPEIDWLLDLQASALGMPTENFVNCRETELKFKP
jgi:hypothetical protein